MGAVVPGTRRTIPRAAVGSVVLVLAVALAPVVFAAPYQRSLLSLMGIYALLAVSYNLIIGAAGVISFGHAGFFATGAYGAAILSVDAGWSMAAAITASMVVSALLGILVGLMSLRVGGVHFAVATLAFAEGLRLVATNAEGLTGGSNGKVVPPGVVELVPGLRLDGDLASYGLIWGALLLALYVVVRLTSTWVGSAFLAIRENEPLARAVGVSPLPYKLAAFAIGGTFASLAGAMYAYDYGIVTPAVSGLHYTALPLLMVMLGGRGTLTGPLVGAAAFALLPELLGLEGEWNEVVFGLVLLVVVLLLPRGVVPGLAGLVRGGRRTSPEPAGPVPLPQQEHVPAVHS
jgi:branched-chain amino acid transport system permease protein